MIKPVGGVDPVLIYGAPAYSQRGRQVLIANTDELHPAFYAEDLTLVNGQASTIPPLGSVGLDGQADVWASSLLPGTTIALDVIPGGQQWAASPAQIAEQISAAGIPPIDNPQPLNNSPVFNQTIAAGGTYTSPRMTVKQFQSWFGKMFCTATASGTGTTPFVQFEMNWSVASDNFDPLRTEDWVVPITPFNFLYNYINQGQGPIIGDTLTLVVTNLDSQPVNLTYGLFGSFRSRNRSIWRGQYQWNAGTGAPDPTKGLGTDDVLASFVTGIVATGTFSANFLMNLWEGPATVSGFNLANNCQIFITPLPTGVLAAPTYVLPTTGAVVPPTQVILPRRACYLSVFNNSGGNINAQVLITGQDQPE